MKDFLNGDLRPVSNEEMESILNEESGISTNSYGCGSGSGSGSGSGCGCGCGSGSGSGSGSGCGCGSGSGDSDLKEITAWSITKKSPVSDFASKDNYKLSVSGEVSATVTKYRTVDEDGKIVGERIEGSATAKIQGESKVNKVGNVEYRTSGFSAVEESKSYSDSSTIFNVTGLPPISLSTSLGGNSVAFLSVEVHASMTISPEGRYIIHEFRITANLN